MFRRNECSACTLMITKKRLMDLLISLCAIGTLLPAFLIIAVLIWIDDRGPILFRQKRFGRNGKKFTIYKFRKFTIAGNDTGPKVTLQNDRRYSRVGKILERTKLNELPQLLNVVKGEMSVVGPRPEILDFGHCFVGEHKELLNFFPGIFGPSQTIFRNEALMYGIDCNPEKVYSEVLFPIKAKIDIQYYNMATCLSDLYWICRSVISVLNDFLPSSSKENYTVPSDLSNYLTSKSSSQ